MKFKKFNCLYMLLLYIIQYNNIMLNKNKIKKKIYY